MHRVAHFLLSNLRNNQEEFIEFATRQTELIAKLETKRFAFKGKLENAIVRKVFPRAKRGEVFIAGNQNKKAIMNEFGQSPPKKVPNIGEMREWVEKKAPHLLGNDFVPVGFPGGRSHVISPNPQNRFWGVTAALVERDIDNMFAHYLTKAIEKS